MKFLFENLQPMPAPRPRVSRKGWTYMPSNYQKYVELLVYEIKKRKPTQLKGNLGIKAYFNRRGKKRADYDNFLKPIGDALQKSGVIENDNQITEGEFKIYYGVNKPTLSFEIWELQDKK